MIPLGLKNYCTRIFVLVPLHVAVQVEDLQQLCLQLHDQPHVVQLQSSHFLAIWQSSSLCPATNNFLYLLIKRTISIQMHTRHSSLHSRAPLP